MSLHLEWSSEIEEFQPDEKLVAKLEELLRLAGAAENVPDGEVALTFVDDEAIRKLNKEYRNLDRPTDVLSFAMNESGEDEMEILFDSEEEDMEEYLEDQEDLEALDGSPELDRLPEDEPGFDELTDLLGDIVISVPRALEQSKEYGHSFERELGFLFVHGFLHLIGFDHQTEEEEKEMFARQEQILQQAGLIR